MLFIFFLCHSGKPNPIRKSNPQVTNYFNSFPKKRAYHITEIYSTKTEVTNNAIQTTVSKSFKKNTITIKKKLTTPAGFEPARAKPKR